MRLLLAICIILFNVNYSFAQEISWEKVDNGIYEASVGSVVIASSGGLIAATDKAVYASNDGAESWQRMLFLPKSSMSINDITMIDNSLDVYIATTEGLYRVSSNSEKVDHVFKAWNRNRKDVKCIKSIKESKLYIGTKAGLFISNDNGAHWKAIGYFKNKSIVDVAFLDRDIFVAADNGVYKGNTFSDSWSRVLVVASSEMQDVQDDEYENVYENEAITKTITSLRADAVAKVLYVGTSKGVHISPDKGSSWDQMTDEGLISRYIEDIIILNIQIAVATSKGVFLLDELRERWQAAGNSHHTKKLAYDKARNRIYAATVNGLYGYTFSNKEEPKPDKKNHYTALLRKQIELEPPILQIQNAAIEYAEVSPDKIKWMRSAARNKALLPTVTMGFDYDADSNINLDRGGTNDADVFILGPDEESWAWDISLSWNLGELIWNDDQTSIDVRSKLMVQLRDDILTEITNLYFERRKLQMDIIDKEYSGAIASAKILRLQELTAKIDGLTGGYLSQNGGYCEETTQKRP